MIREEGAMGETIARVLLELAVRERAEMSRVLPLERV